MALSREVPPARNLTASSSGELHRELGFWHLTASGVGIIVGAGIYVLIGAATAKAGGGVWLSFLLAAVLSTLTALSYCELAALYPSAGGEYEYARHVFPESIAFLVGWLMVAGLIVGGAVVALGFARYLNEFVDAPLRPSAVGILLCALTVAIGGIKQSGRLTIVLALVQIAGLALVIVLGVPHLGTFNLVPTADAGGIIGGAALIFFAFIGFDEVITLSEETRDPARTVPRALIAALAISAGLYMLVAVTSVSVLGPAALAASPRPLADVLKVSLGGVSTQLIAFVALASTANAALLMLTAASRLTYAMARSGALPARLGRATQKRGVPIAAILVCGAVASVFIFAGDLSRIASVTDFAVYLVFLAVDAAVVILRLREPALARPFKIPFAVAGVPILPVLGFITTLVMLTRLDVWTIVGGATIVFVGALAAQLRTRNRTDLRSS